MGSLSLGQWIIVIIALGVFGLPFWKIVKRTGMPPALSLLWFVPVVNLVFLWVFAFAEWPVLNQENASEARVTDTAGEMPSRPTHKRTVGLRREQKVIAGLVVGIVVFFWFAHQSARTSSDHPTSTAAPTTQAVAPDMAPLQSQTPPPTQSPGTPNQREIYRTTAVDLYLSYERNEVATDETIGRRLIEVSGVVESIDKDFMDDIVIRLATGNEFSAAGMTMLASEKSKAIALSKGRRVTIRCDKMHRIMNSPEGTDCYFL